MRVGCPKEIKNHEYRVGLTPAAVREYVAHGHEVWIETKAGAGIGADDASYIAAGAKIAASAKDIFEKCDMIVKVKEPQPSEWAQLREGQLLYTYLHLAPDPEQTKGLLASGVTAIAYETVTDDRGGLPLLAPMSEVAGRLSVPRRGAGPVFCWAACPACCRQKSRSSAVASSGFMRPEWQWGLAPTCPFWIARCRVCASSTIYLAVAFIPAIPAFRRLKMKSSLLISSSAPC